MTTEATSTQQPGDVDALEYRPSLADKLWWSAEDLAFVLGLSVRHVRSLDTQGKIPRPIPISHLAARVVRWDVDEIRRWNAAGQPPRDDWESMQEVDNAAVDGTNGFPRIRVRDSGPV